MLYCDHFHINDIVRVRNTTTSVCTSSLLGTKWEGIRTRIEIGTGIGIKLHIAEQGMGRWVMGHGSNGSRKSDGSHGSWVTRC